MADTRLRSNWGRYGRSAAVAASLITLLVGFQLNCGTGAGTGEPGAQGPGSGPGGGPQGPGQNGDDDGKENVVPGPNTPAGPVAVDKTPGTWRTAWDPKAGRFTFISPQGTPAVLKGVSMTGLETGTRETQAGGGYWLFQNKGGDAKGAMSVLGNVVETLTGKWKSSIVRIPICGSAWTQNYVVRDWGKKEVGGYHEWVDAAVKKARSRGSVVILDLHLWAVAKMSKGGGPERGTFVHEGKTYKYSDYEDGCNGVNKVDGKDSCAPSDWYSSDDTTWQCAIANADGVSLHNAYKNKDSIATMWSDVAQRYKGDSAVWFELFNEPYSRKAPDSYPGFGANDEEKDYHWGLWTESMNQWIAAIRDKAKAKNIILVNGLDWGYSFGPDHGPIAKPSKYLPWATKYANIAYGWHPYQHGSCCGKVGAGDRDEGVNDPYQSAYCSYYPNGKSWGDASNAPLPGGVSCVSNGYVETQDKKMPPCHWVAQARNPRTNSLGLCAGERAICNPLSKAECDAMDWTSPKAGGWSRYVLPMAKYGPLVATEFGSFDCSSPYVHTLLRYMDQLGLSYTAWALWPQNSGGPGGLGACGYPSVMAPDRGTGDFQQCSDRASCESLMSPLPWAGRAVFDHLTR